MRDNLARKNAPGAAASSETAAEAARYAKFLPAAQALIGKEHSPLARLLVLTIPGTVTVPPARRAGRPGSLGSAVRGPYITGTVFTLAPS